MMMRSSEDFVRPIPHTRQRMSTYARDGSNHDTVLLGAGETWAALIGGAGEIRHIWFECECTQHNASLSNIQLLIWFDENPIPAVNAPLGDFVGLGHDQFNYVKCGAFDASPYNDPKTGGITPLKGIMNFWLPMPYSNGVRIELRNRSVNSIALGAYIDSLKFEDESEVSPYRFHATYRESFNRAAETGAGGEILLNNTGEENYTLLDLQNAQGNYVGSILHSKSLPDDGGEWHEGDDMFFIDGVSWPPTLHGSGTMNYFNLSSMVREPVQTDYHGVSHFEPLYEDGRPSERMDGKFSLYRLHTLDPIPFTSSILATLEHGHANSSNAIFRSVAFWYGIGADQTEKAVDIDKKAHFGNPGIICVGGK